MFQTQQNTAQQTCVEFFMRLIVHNAFKDSADFL